MLADDASVLDGHIPTGEGYHLGTIGYVPLMKWRGQKLGQ
jgi:hypothetical protein